MAALPKDLAAVRSPKARAALDKSSSVIVPVADPEARDDDRRINVGKRLTVPDFTYEKGATAAAMIGSCGGGSRRTTNCLLEGTGKLFPTECQRTARTQV
jgi:hypothetical protein